MKNDDFWGDPISVYLSEDAERDGLLIRVNDPHINFITSNVYETCIKPFLGIAVTKEEILLQRLINSVKLEVINIQKKKGLGWFYKVEARSWIFYVCQNETGKYTLLFPEEY